jgi:hypothetical protein
MAKTRKKTVKKLSDITEDPNNANKGTERGRSMVVSSLQDSGPGRSIVVDKGGIIIAGSKTHAAWNGLSTDDDIIVVPSDGSKLVVVQRTDLDLSNDISARQLAYADNRANEIGLNWDLDQMSRDVKAGLDMDMLFDSAELTKLLHPSADDDESIDKTDLSGVNDQLQFRVIVECKNESEQAKLLEELEERGHTCQLLMS